MVVPANTRLPHSDPEMDATLSVVIAYQDLDSGKNAQRMFDFLVRNVTDECRFVSRMWRFELLAVPGFRKMAADDAALADLIFVSCHGVTDLPVDVKAWIELWLGRPHSPFALVALFDHTNEPHVCATQEYLEAVARRGGMGFFAQPDIWPDNPASHTHVSPANLELPLPLAAVSARDASVGHWGLNE